MLILHFQTIAPLVDYSIKKIKIINRSLRKTVHFIKEILKSNSHLYIYSWCRRKFYSEYFLCILLLKIVTNKFSLSTFFFFNFLLVKFICLSYPNIKFRYVFREKSGFFLKLRGKPTNICEFEFHTNTKLFLRVGVKIILKP